MPSCEMCGNETPGLRRTVVEGTLMNLCPNCSRFGVQNAGHAQEVTGRSKVVESLARRAQRAAPKDVLNEMQEELVAEYPELIRKARVARHLTPDELCDKLQIRRGTITKLEAGEMHPDDALVKKLESFLGLKLMEKPEPVVGVGKRPAGTGAGGFTLGDLIRKEKDKK